MAARPWVLQAGGLVLTVRLTPRGGRDAIDGIEVLADGRCVLKARVRVPPSEGEANAALIRLIAGALGVAPRTVTPVAGGHCADQAPLPRGRGAGARGGAGEARRNRLSC